MRRRKIRATAVIAAMVMLISQLNIMPAAADEIIFLQNDADVSLSSIIEDRGAEADEESGILIEEEDGTDPDRDLIYEEISDETESETETEPESETGSMTETESETEAKSETEAESETKAESENSSETESETESMSGTESETETESGSEAESMSGTESGSETESESETESGSETESMSGTESESEMESETEFPEETMPGRGLVRRVPAAVQAMVRTLTGQYKNSGRDANKVQTVTVRYQYENPDDPDHPLDIPYSSKLAMILPDLKAADRAASKEFQVKLDPDLSEYGYKYPAGTGKARIFLDNNGRYYKDVEKHLNHNPIVEPVCDKGDRYYWVTHEGSINRDLTRGADPHVVTIHVVYEREKTTEKATEETTEENTEKTTEETTEETTKETDTPVIDGRIHYVGSISDEGAESLSSTFDPAIPADFDPDIESPDVYKPNQNGSSPENLFYDVRKDNMEGKPGLSVLTDLGYQFRDAYLVKDGDLSGRVRITAAMGIFGVDTEFGSVRVYRYKHIGSEQYYDYDPQHDEIYVLYQKPDLGGKIHYGITDENGVFHQLQYYENVPEMKLDQQGYGNYDQDDDKVSLARYNVWKKDDAGNSMTDQDGSKILNDQYTFENAYVVTADGQQIALNPDNDSLIHDLTQDIWTYIGEDGQTRQLTDQDELFINVTKTGLVKYGFVDGSGSFVEFGDHTFVLKLPGPDDYLAYKDQGRSLLEDRKNIYDSEGNLYQYSGKAVLMRDNAAYSASGAEVGQLIWPYDGGSVYNWQYSGDAGTFRQGDVVYLLYDRADTENITDPTVLLGTPRHQKWLDDHGDGTYTLNLSVEGNSAEKNSSQSDIVLVVDASSSMLASSRLPDEKGALRALSETIFAAGTGNNRVHIISFGTRASEVTTVVSKAEMDNWIDTFTPFGTSDDAGNTNWEDALVKADSVLNSLPSASGKSVIFISDGVPTVRDTKGGSWYPFYWDAPLREGEAEKRLHDHFGVYGSGFIFDKNVSRCYTPALDAARSLVQSGASLYAVSVFGDARDYMQRLVNYAYTGSEYGSGAPENHYMTGSDEESIKNAVLTAAQGILKSYTFKNFKIQDQLSPLTSTLHDLALDTNDPYEGNVRALRSAIESAGTLDFEYWYAERRDDNKDQKDSQLEWKKWKQNPSGSAVIPQARFNYQTKVIEWDLAQAYDPALGFEQAGVLPKNVAFKVTCTVWPNQEAYDRIDKLIYGKDERPFGQAAEDESIRQVKDGADYRVYSNVKSSLNGGQDPERSALLTYEAAEYRNGQLVSDGGRKQLDYERPVMEVYPAKLCVRKVWKDSEGNILDPEKPADAAQLPESLTVKVREDETDGYHTVILNQENGWKDCIPVVPALFSTWVRNHVSEYYKEYVGQDFIIGSEGVALNRGHAYFVKEEDSSGGADFRQVGFLIGGLTGYTDDTGIRPIYWAKEPGKGDIYVYDCEHGGSPQKIGDFFGFTFINQLPKKEVLPATGGMGKKPFAWAGLSMMLLSAILIILCRRKEILSMIRHQALLLSPPSGG